MSKLSRNCAKGRHILTISLLLAIGLGGMADISAQPDNGRAMAVEHMKKVLEQPFLEHGGFSEFDCTLTSSAQSARPFTCTATAMGDKDFEYLVVPDSEAGIKIEMVTEPASQLEYEWLPALDKTCRQFLKHFNQEDWQGLYAEFHPNLQKMVSLATLETSLGPIHEQLGLLAEPQLESYSLRDGGRDELQYSVPAENGQAVFRCGLNATESGITVLAYLLAPHPDGELYKTTLENDAAVHLSTALGQAVSRVDIPYAQLPNVYDAAESVGIFENGDEFKIRVIRSGRLDDFNPKDYTFQALKTEQ